MISFDPVKKIADAVLHEGYLLYPYTASARKNRTRWQFGVLMPPQFANGGSAEPSSMQTEVMVEPQGAPSLALCVRFLHVQSRTIQRRCGETFAPVQSLRVDGNEYLTWDEAVEREVTRLVCLHPAQREIVAIDVPENRSVETLRDSSGRLCGRIVRERSRLRGTIAVTAESAGDLLRVRVRVENTSALVGSERPLALRTALVSTHTLLGVERGRFISMLDPPPFASDAVRACVNQHTWPVLAGEASDDGRCSTIVLSAPIILYDFPAVSEQSGGDAFDGTEIDELLSLSVLSMTDDEKREARATDAAARDVVERADSLTAERLASLHASMQATAAPEAAEDTTLVVRGHSIGKGSRVRLRPSRRADVWDTFIDGKTARVRGIYRDMDDRMYVAVVVEDDPASEFHEWYGRSLFFYPDEIEPLEVSAP